MTVTLFCAASILRLHSGRITANMIVFYHKEALTSRHSDGVVDDWAGLKLLKDCSLVSF